MRLAAVNVQDGPVRRWVTGYDAETGIVNYVEVFTVDPLPRLRAVPHGIGDYIGLEPLATMEIRPGMTCIYDGREAIVCVPPPKWEPARASLSDHVLIRYTDGNRERVLVSAWDCAVDTDK